MDHELFTLAQFVGQALQAQQKMLVTAESCTGGWIAQVLTDVPGSSLWFDRGFVTYSNAAKIQMLGVKPETLEDYGAVSAQTVTEMVAGALLHSDADVAIAVTGVAGPSGGTEEKPVGTIFIAWASKAAGYKVMQQSLSGNRQEIRRQTVVIALKGLADSINA
jgi:nicotinamide-nucleotide amidase